ncbi:hypothetical protein J2S43_007519 [Catenuloplanes nepalensis]|uniref:Uncharacterized protein n=1 Tax=Catenuloplanes nepalensis TaxID=587533 RepID=A0ABT9N5N0_9ACTN|nr:hypothetical protein [Catenuloplanes nepalensis]MDP9799007.1 hypothetical protein [Catenuloplanes nepalensis]
MPKERLQVEFEISTVDGERGKRLAALQARAILEILCWWSEHRPDLQHNEYGSPLQAEPPR